MEFDLDSFYKNNEVKIESENYFKKSESKYLRLQNIKEHCYKILPILFFFSNNPTIIEKINIENLNPKYTIEENLKKVFPDSTFLEAEPKKPKYLTKNPFY